MLPLTISRVILVYEHLDFRKQWNGLLSEARKLGFEPYDGDMVVFVKKDRTQIRGICGDGKGLYLISRRFEGGRLRFLFGKGKKEISLAELSLWLSGTHFTIHRTVRNWK